MEEHSIQGGGLRNHVKTNRFYGFATVHECKIIAFKSILAGLEASPVIDLAHARRQTLQIMTKSKRVCCSAKEPYGFIDGGFDFVMICIVWRRAWAKATVGDVEML